MSKPEEFLKKIARAYLELKENDPEEFERISRESDKRYEERKKRRPDDMTPDEAFDLSIAEANAEQAFVPLRKDLGRDGEGERFELLTHYIRRKEIPPELAELGAEQLGMTVDEFLERVAFMDERLEFHFRNVVAQMNDPEYVEEETQYLLSLMDRAIKPRETH